MDENPNANPNNNLETIRTFQSDIQKVIKEGGGSLSKIALAENEKRTRDGKSYSSEEIPDNSIAPKLIVWTSISLFVLGAGFLVFFYISAVNKKNEAAPVINGNPVITYDSEKKILLDGLTRRELARILTEERDTARNPLGSVERILFTKNKNGATSEAAVSDFLGTFESIAPAELARSLDDSFAFGFHSFKENEPFLVFKINYYQNGFAGMLAWESRLEEDLGDIFVRPYAIAPASTTADILGGKNIFHDAVLQNFDTRVLKKNNGEIVLLYSFINKNTLVITTNSDTLAEVSRRILAGRMVQ